MSYFPRTFFKALLHFGPILVIVAGGILFYLKVPSEKDIKGCLVTKMRKVHLCPRGKDYIPLKLISSNLKKAVLLTEDSSFYNHEGFDWDALEEALKKNLEKGGYARGGSTISQQLAKNMFLTEEKSLLRKAWEAIFTIKIENTLSKNEIFERYLNVVQFGPDIYGVKEACYFYFKKHPKDIDLIESIFLAFVLPSPEKYSQSYFKKELTPYAYKRMENILELLLKYNRITIEEYDDAIYRLPKFPYHSLVIRPEEDSFDNSITI